MESNPQQRFTRDDLPPDSLFRAFRKRTLTRAVRIVGPFEVETREGVLGCPDGWLAIDSGGWPYPIAAEEFDRIYEPEWERANGPWTYDARNDPAPEAFVNEASGPPATPTRRCAPPMHYFGSGATCECGQHPTATRLA